MRIELLPSSIPSSANQYLVSFLVNDSIAIDAGSIGFLADLRRQEAIRHVFITHEHLDHIASLPIFLENVYSPGPDAIELLASQKVLDFIHVDIFNGRVWPDFFELSRPDDRFLETTALEPLVAVQRAGIRLTPVPVSHGIDTLGLIVDDGRSAVAFPSDTGPTQLLWDTLAGLRNLRAVFLEVSFPATLADLARMTGHHCTTSFAEEIRKLSTDAHWIIVHRKTRYAAQIAAELEAMRLPNVELVRPGEVYEF
jgi:ribonuclease BN (tRNA processing enzyme)